MKDKTRNLPARIGKTALRVLAFLGMTVLLLVAGLYFAMFVIVKGPSPSAGRLFVLSLKETSAGGFLADWYMSADEIAKLRADGAKESDSEVDVSLIKLPEKKETGEKGDEDVIGDDAGAEKNETGIEIVDVSGSTYNGKMMIISDPTRVMVGVPNGFGEGCSGLSLSKMIEKYGAVGGTNAGGFVDPNGTGTGGIPDGIVISDGELLWGEDGKSYSLAGLDGDGILYVGRMTPEKAMKTGLKYAVSYGPALIINGEPCNAGKSLGGGINPRTAIGQREDGAILLLVVNGRQIDSLGATLDDLVEIMLSHGAVNASNLDGGSSSLMKYEGEYLNTSSYIYGGERILASTILVK